MAALLADQAERIKSLPYDAVTAGSRDEGKYVLDWQVQSFDPKKVVLRATFSAADGAQLADTVVLYIEK